MRKYILIFSILLICIGSSAFSQNINSPSDLEAEFEDWSYVKVRWNDNSTNEDGFLIERALDADTLRWEIVGQAPQNARIFGDYWIIFNRLFHYRVYAYNSTGTSGYSNSDTVYTYGDTVNLPAAPTNLRVTKTTITSVNIQWNDNANNELGFIVARKRPELPYFEFIDSVGSDVLTYQEVGLTPDNVYFYKVCAFNGYGISDYTNTVSARTENSSLIQTNSISAESFYLKDNYPNPFNPSTTIEFGLRQSSEVRLTIFDAAGREAAVLFSGVLPPGSYMHTWNASSFASGLYFARLDAVPSLNSSPSASGPGKNGKLSATKKIILAK